ncbi:MAG: biotin transporter BioY [Lachnospiraceae bacterium]|nr:biotin transporter BioY [Lachnospiraceae bacterium]
MNNKKNLGINDITYISLFTALIAICSWISIPTPIPFTLQTFAIFATICMLGGKRSTISILVYILLGAVGLPVFSGFSGGFGKLLGNTGGYIIGFLFSSLVVWLITRLFGTKTPVMITAMITGLFVCYAFGTIWFITVYLKADSSISIGTVLSWCVFPFIIPDIIKISFALLVSKRLGKYINI